MAVSSIRIDDDVKKETVRIAEKLGLSFNTVIDISLRQFNRNKGFSEPLRLQEELPKSYMEMSAEEMDRAVQRHLLGIEGIIADNMPDYMQTAVYQRNLLQIFKVEND